MKILSLILSPCCLVHPMNMNYSSFDQIPESPLDRLQRENREMLEKFEGPLHKFSVEGIPENVFGVIFFGGKHIYSCAHGTIETIMNFYLSDIPGIDRTISFQLNGRNAVGANAVIISKAFAGKRVIQKFFYNNSRVTSPKKAIPPNPATPPNKSDS